MPSVAGDRLRRGAAVAGQHDDADPVLAERPERLGRRGLDRVGHRDQARRAIVDDEEHRRLPFPAQRLGPLAELPRGHAERLQEPRVAKRDAAARDRARHPLPRGHPEVGGFLQREPALLRAVDDRAGERVLAPALEAGRQAEELCLVVGRQGHDGREPGAALRQRAGLVDDERVHLLQDLERLGVLDEDARRRAPAGPHHDGHRRREAERAGARDDQDGHAVRSA